MPTWKPEIRCCTWFGQAAEQKFHRFHGGERTQNFAQHPEWEARKANCEPTRLRSATKTPSGTQSDRKCGKSVALSPIGWWLLSGRPRGDRPGRIELKASINDNTALSKLPFSSNSDSIR